MKEAEISDNDVVPLDRAITPRSGHVVIAMLDGEFVCKTLFLRNGRMKLKAANVTYPDISPALHFVLESAMFRKPLFQPLGTPD